MLNDIPLIETEEFQNTAYYQQLSQKEQSMVDFYHENGYLLVEDTNILEDVNLEELKQVVINSNDGTGKLQDIWTISLEVKKIAIHEQILNIIKILYDREPIPFQTLSFIHGTEQRTHSDFIHFNTLPNHWMCGVWVALEDITLKQGPLHYYEGSHKLPSILYEDMHTEGYLVNRSFYEIYEQVISNLARPFPKKYLPVKKGSFLIWASNLLHGGSPIEDRSLTRWSQVTHYFFDSVVPVTPMLSSRQRNEWFVRQPINIKTGKKMNISYSGQATMLVPKNGKYAVVTNIPSLSSIEKQAQSYLNRYPDVARGINNSKFSAWLHYQVYGIHENHIWE